MTTANDVKRRWGWPEWASVILLTVSPASTVITGSEAASVVVLLGMFVGCWALLRLPRRVVGFTWGDLGGHAVAIGYPIIVIGVLSTLAIVFGAGTLAVLDAKSTLVDLGIMFAATALGTLITEEGFFRGWLWAAIRRKGTSETGALVWTASVFTLWHVPVAMLEPNLVLPVAILPVYFMNAMLLGLAWGILRMATGSVVVSAVSHGTWNALSYVLFGYGLRTGSLSVFAYDVFGPERGLLGVALNLIAVIGLWHWYRRKTQD